MRDSSAQILLLEHVIVQMLRKVSLIYSLNECIYLNSRCRRLPHPINCTYTYAFIHFLLHGVSTPDIIIRSPFYTYKIRATSNGEKNVEKIVYRIQCLEVSPSTQSKLNKIQSPISIVTNSGNPPAMPLRP